MSVNELAPLSPTASLDDVTRALGVVIENLRLREPTSTGETRDKFVTWKDAETAGIATFTAGGAVGSGGGSTTIIVPGGGGGGSTTPDLSPPSPITNLQVSAGLSFHMITFDAPVYTQGGGNAYTEIFAANYSGTGPQPTFANAAQIATVPGRGSIITIPSEPGLTKHFWAGAVTLAGVRQIDGVGATGGTNGVSATTGQDPSYLLSVLSDSITDSQLDATLKGRINLVDGPDTLPGSVAARLLAEAQARGTAISNEATIRSDADSALSQTITTLTSTVATNNNTLTSALQNEATARASADSAEATARQTLAAQVSSAINQVDSSWWAPGASLPSGWARNGTATENSFVHSADHTSKTATLWRCTSEDPLAPEPDGGWEALMALDRSKTYRFMLPVRKNSGTTGYAYWGFYTADGDANPYFTIPPLANLEVGEWHWMVGFVYPVGSSGQTNDSAGTYANQTGARVWPGSNFRWSASGVQLHRAYLFYAEAGAQIDFGRPLVHLVDGNEPPLDAIIRGTAGAVAAAQALVTLESQARVTAVSAVAQSVTTLSATVDDNTSAIQTVSQATADLEGHVAASYSVRAQVTAGGRTAVGGFGLTGEVGASGPTITFGVVANQFWVGAPEGTPGINADILPFVIQTSPTTINGVTIPVGVYMDAAYITNLTALIARFGTAWIDNAMIANMSAGKITSGSIQVGEYIQSTGYTPGVAGFRITGSGSAEFSSIIARGTIYASGGAIGGAVIDSTGVRSTNFVQGVSGWRLDNNLGKLFAMSGQIGGSSIEGERLVTRYGSTMKVEGAPFGTSNQFVLWWGPILSDIALCSELNATIQYVKTNGDAYFGGALAAGVLKNSARTSTTIATAEIEVGPFLTNGNSKTIVVSYGYSYDQQGNHGSMSLTGSGGATVTLERSIGGGAWVTLQTFSTSPASGELFVDDDPTAPDVVSWGMGQAITTTDTSAATTNMRLRARITARSLMTVGGTGLSVPIIVQSLSVTCTEQ